MFDPQKIVENALAPRPLLDPRDPMPSARALADAVYTSADGKRLLHHHRGTFYQWTGCYYREADSNNIQAATWAFLDKAERKTEDGAAPFQPNRARVGDVLAALAAICNLPGHLDPPAWLLDCDYPAAECLAVQNGLMHLPSGDLIDASPDFFNLNAAGTRFDPEARPPRQWLAFLAQLWPRDSESIGALQDMFGYFLTGNTAQHKIMLIVGPARSGKGTIARVLTALLGQDSVCAPTLASLAGTFGLQPLIGKPLAIIGDARLGSHADQAAIAERLLSISGEDGQTVDRKFLAPWSGRLPTRFLIISNELPRLADASGALASRFIVLTLEQSWLGREDLGLLGRLKPELPGILNWARQGYLRLRQRGAFLQPTTAREAIADLEALGSPIKAFIADRCTVGKGLQCMPELLFAAWRDWCAANNRKEAGTVQTFGRDLRAAVPGLRTSNLREGDDKRTRYYEGIKLGEDKQDG